MSQPAFDLGDLADAPGAEDCPTTSRQHIKDQGRRWAEAAGAIVKNGDPEGLEVSPLTSYVSLLFSFPFLPLAPPPGFTPRPHLFYF